MLSIGEIIEYAKACGLLNLLKVGIKGFVFLHMKRIVLSLSLEDPIPQPKAYQRFLRSITIRKATLADIAELHRVMKQHKCWRSVRELREWMKKDCFLFIAIHKGKIVGYTCVCAEIPSSHSIFSKTIRLRPRDAYGVHAFVVPAYRGKMVYHALMMEICRCARAAGYRRILATVDPLNRAARSSHRRVGMKEIAELTVLKVLFFTWVKVHWVKPEAVDLFARRVGIKAPSEGK